MHLADGNRFRWVDPQEHGSRPPVGVVVYDCRDSLGYGSHDGTEVPGDGCLAGASLDVGDCCQPPSVLVDADDFVLELLLVFVTIGLLLFEKGTFRISGRLLLALSRELFVVLDLLAGRQGVPGR